MCGIAGIVRADGHRAEPDVLAAMCAAIAHRGPDVRGTHVEGPVGLGAQRLRVIDLRTGDQPLYNEDRSVAVVLNGEIYNFRELRERLRGNGHRLTTSGDTEVIAHLYEEEGVDCVRRLHGMFAFALWDSRRRRLLIARDRVGKKPLHYAHRDGALSFASEIPSLLQDPEVPRGLDVAALDAYLAYGYVPAPLSAFAAVRKLPPASTLVYEEGRVTIDRYWRLDYARKLDLAPADQDAAVREAIRRAVRRRMVADVPMGAFLSGGIDSSVVVAAMAEASPEPVKTFSIGFTSDAYDELAHARRIAERFGTDHHEEVVRPDAVTMLPRVVRAYGEPFGDPSAVPSFYLAALARGQVTVALNGDGGDESFAGYPRYPSNVLAARSAIVPAGARRALGALAERLPASGRIDSAASRLRRAGRTLALEPLERYTEYVTTLGGLPRDAMYTPEFAEQVTPSVAPDVVGAPWRNSTATALIDRLLDVDVNTYLPGDLLVKMDIATMAHSLEARSPLLDHELMELAAAIPARRKLRGLQKKVALRAALRGWLPDETLDRPKRGFEPPVADWLRTDLRAMARDVLLDPRALGRGYFRAEAVTGLLDRHQDGIEDHSRGLWALLVFELWHQEVVD